METHFARPPSFTRNELRGRKHAPGRGAGAGGLDDAAGQQREEAVGHHAHGGSQTEEAGGGEEHLAGGEALDEEPGGWDHHCHGEHESAGEPLALFRWDAQGFVQGGNGDRHGGFVEDRHESCDEK